jgi:hypothetical protein
MGGTPSKLDLPDKPVFDLSKATVDLPSVQQFQDKATSAFDTVSKQAQVLNSQVMTTTSYLQILIGLVVAGGIGYIIYNYAIPYFRTWASMGGGPPSGIDPSKNLTSGLNIFSAESSSGIDIKNQLVNKISGNGIQVKLSEKLGIKPGDSVLVSYQHIGGKPETKTVSYGDILKIEDPQHHETTASFWSTTTGDQLPSIKDAKIVQTIPSANAPQNSAAYGYQFWMYISDWNYKFGQEKSVFSRNDPANKSVSNPAVFLHPTDNSLKISVSVYPNEKTSKNEPAPANNSGMNDDVFICEVPNVPLQQWVAVSVTVSTRNLDIYFNGKLVKSCLLSGIPKPIMGDIVLNDNGGFSGYMCSFNHYSKVLQPSDAQTFYAYGSPCRLPDDSYTTKFGLFDSGGKQVTKYVF